MTELRQLQRTKDAEEKTRHDPHGPRRPAVLSPHCRIDDADTHATYGARCQHEHDPLPRRTATIEVADPRLGSTPAVGSPRFLVHP